MLNMNTDLDPCLKLPGLYISPHVYLSPPTQLNPPSLPELRGDRLYLSGAGLIGSVDHRRPRLGRWQLRDTGYGQDMQ